MSSDPDEMNPPEQVTDQRTPDGKSADDQEIGENTATNDTTVPLEQLGQSFPELLQSYPDAQIALYNIQNYIAGDVTGVVGNRGRFRAREVTVTQPSKGRVPSVSDEAPRLKDTASFEDWFFKTSLDNQIHVLLVAVFAGNSLRLVNEARVLIKNALRPHNDTKETGSDVKLEPFDRTISNMLEETQTDLFGVEYTVESGLTEVTAVGFADPDTHKAALEFMRSSIDIETLRSKLADLLIQVCTMHQIDLRSMGTSMIDLMRSQAAIGLGELAKHDYAHYLSFIIRPWARSRDAFLRFIVGWILFALATDDTRRASVFSLLTHWAKSNNDYLKWTAAAACSRVGLIDIDETLDIIKVLLEADSPHISHALKVSLGLLYLSAQNAYRIVEKFADWSQSSQDDDTYPMLKDNIPPMFLSFIQGKFTDDVSLVDEQGDETEGENGSSFTRIEIWHLVEREMSQGKYTLSRSISSLVRQGFIHNSARIVDWTCEVVEQWIAKGGKQKGNQSFISSICQVLIPLREDRIASRYIRRIINSKKFTDNPVAVRLREAYGTGG